MFKNKDAFKDERITAQQQKIGNEGFCLISVLLLASIIIKSIFFNMHVSQFKSEFIIFLIGSIYVTIRHVLTGSFSLAIRGNNKKDKKVKYYLIVSVISGLLAGLAMGIRNYIIYDFSILKIPLVILPIMFFLTPLLFVILYSLDIGATKRADKIANDDE